MPPSDPAALDQVFRSARTYKRFTDRSVPDSLLRQLYELMKWGPTSLNSQPGRYLFLRSHAAKNRLAPALAPTNIDKVMSAPVVAIVAMDMRFYDHLKTQSPAGVSSAHFLTNAAVTAATAFRNSSLQGAYLIVAARLLGLDCGPMSGFDEAKVNEAFFPDSPTRINFLINIGYGDVEALHPRGPRLPFDSVAGIL
jgi:3-hydroxypropanoate dehydrogenase